MTDTSYGRREGGSAKLWRLWVVLKITQDVIITVWRKWKHEYRLHCSAWLARYKLKRIAHELHKLNKSPSRWRNTRLSHEPNVAHLTKRKHQCMQKLFWLLWFNIVSWICRQQQHAVHSVSPGWWSHSGNYVIILKHTTQFSVYWTEMLCVCVCNGKLNEGDEQRIFSPDGLGSSN